MIETIYIARHGQSVQLDQPASLNDLQDTGQTGKMHNGRWFTVSDSLCLTGYPTTGLLRALLGTIPWRRMERY